MNDGSKSKEFRFTGTHMLVCMLLFFGVIVVVNFTMAAFASRSWTGLVVKNSYVASQEFNEKLAMAEKQKALGWRSTLTYQDDQLAFTLHKDDGEIIFADSVNAQIGRPAHEQQDQQFAFLPDGKGRFIKTHVLEPGVWSIRMDVLAGDQHYRRDARIVVSENGSGVVE